MIVVPILALIHVSLLPALTGHTVVLWVCGTMLAGVIFLYQGLGLVLDKSSGRARRLLLMSVVYLPVVFGLLITRAF